MKPVDWTPEAYAGLRDQLAYYSDYSQAAGERLARRVDEAMLTLGTLSHGGRVRGSYRTFAMPSTNIVLIYRVKPNRIEIAACVDGRENLQHRF